MYGFTASVDARTYAPRDKHPTIMTTFHNLKSGDMMELINDHDPRPLLYQFIAEMPDQFVWEYIEQGPDVWRVAIQKK